MVRKKKTWDVKAKSNDDFDFLDSTTLYCTDDANSQACIKPKSESGCSAGGNNPEDVLQDVLIDEITGDDLYAYLIKQFDGITQLDDKNTAFAIQDFKTDTLKPMVYYIIQRKPVLFSGEPAFAYCCNCNHLRNDLVKSWIPGCEVGGSSAEVFSGPYSDCQHIAAFLRVVAQKDMIHKVTPESLISESSQRSSISMEGPEHCYSSKGGIYTLLNEPRVVVVQSDSGFVTVGLDNSLSPKCSSCYHKYSCKHVKAVKAECTMGRLPGFQQHMNQEVKWRTIHNPKPVSSKEIPFLVEQLSNKGSFHDKASNTLIPDASGVCTCGAAWSNADPVQCGYLHTSSSIIYEHCIIPVNVYYRKCLSVECDHRKLYDGDDLKVLNMGTYMVSHKILRAYMRQFLTHGTPVTAFYKELSWRLFDEGFQLVKHCSENQFRYAWLSFLSLLTADFEEGFVCPGCGPRPDILIMDGCSIGINRRYVNSVFQQEGKGSELLHGSRFSDRVFIPDKKVRNSLEEYLNHGLEANDHKKLLSQLQRHQPALVELCSDLGPDTSHLPKNYKDLLKGLAKPSCVSGIIHFHENIESIFSKISDGQVIQLPHKDRKLIQKHCPLIANVLLESTSVPVGFTKMIHGLMMKVKKIESYMPHDLQPGGHESLFSHFPGLNVLCARGTYAMDNKTDKSSCETKRQPDCKKKSRGHPTLTPGIFSIFCIHGICYGYEIMTEAESPAVPFRILRTRFAAAPAVIIYDNACNLQAYCMNRDPGFFKRTFFLVDRFHWVNHTGCSYGFCMDVFSHLQKINSQVAEQRHATLLKFRPMLHYMTLDSFRNHLKLFTWFKNLLLILKHFPEVPKFLKYKSVASLFQ